MDFLDSKVAGVLITTFEDVFSFSERDAWHEKVNRLGVEVVFDTMKWLIGLEKEHLVCITREEHARLFETGPHPTWHFTQLVNRSFFYDYEITCFINSLNTFDLTNGDLISDEALQILKATTYYNLFQVSSDPNLIYR